MDWLQFISSVIGSLAWPIVVIAAIFLLRKPLVELLLKLRSLKYKDLALDFGEKLREAEDEAAKLPPQPEELIQPPPDIVTETRFREISEVSPNSAVFEAWLNVELALKKLALAKGFDFKDARKPVYLMRALRDQNIIDHRTAVLLEDLRALRNVAVHPETESPITTEQAERYKEMADRVTRRLRALAR